MERVQMATEMAHGAHKFFSSTGEHEKQREEEHEEIQEKTIK